MKTCTCTFTMLITVWGVFFFLQTYFQVMYIAINSLHVRDIGSCVSAFKYKVICKIQLGSPSNSQCTFNSERLGHKHSPQNNIWTSFEKGLNLMKMASPQCIHQDTESRANQVKTWQWYAHSSYRVWNLDKINMTWV